jgi:hypothetical protein
VVCRYLLPVIAAFALWVAATPLSVSGGTSCPAPAEVQLRVAALVSGSPSPPPPPAATAPAPGYRASLLRGDDRIHVELFDANDARLAERDLPAGGSSCQDLAAAVAVVLAAWIAEVGPDVDVRPQIPVAVPSLPPPAPAVAASAGAPAAPAPQGTPLKVGVGIGVGIGILASLAGDLAPGAKIDGVVTPGGGRLGLAMTLSGTAVRTIAVEPAPAKGRWTRASLAVGPRYLLRSGAPPVLDVRVQALATLLRAEGVGLPSNASDTSVGLGGGLGLRAGWPRRTAEPWIGLDLLVWPARDYLRVAGVRTERELPRFDVQLAVGISLGRTQ